MARISSVSMLLLAAACSTGGGAPPAETKATGVFREALIDEPQVRWAAVPNEPAQFTWPQQGGVLVVDAQWRLPNGAWPEPVRQQLLAFLQQGGRAVLFGHAAGLAAELGIEPQAPQRREFRWGYDARAVQGSASLGLHVVSGQLPELVDGLSPNSGSDDVWFLTGDTPCTAPLCTWSIGAPDRGVVLARLAKRCDGADDAAGAPVLVHWQVGQGALLACGLVPRLDHPDPAFAATAKAFVQRCAHWAAHGRGLVVLVEADRAPAPAEVALPRMAPLVPHWGWRIGWQADGEDRVVADLVRESLEPGWLAGADLCELDLAGADGAVPLLWRPEDPLKPAPSFESRPEARHFDGNSFREVCTEAHLRSMLAFASLDPLPVGERAAERLATLRFLARELACVRRFPTGAFDGFGVRRWLADKDGLSLAMLGDFAPAAVFYRTGETGGDVAGALRALDADDGALPGLPYCGLSDTWRPGFAPERFPLGVLDARARIAGEGELGAGSTGDWIVHQANDFVRARAGHGAAMWWRRHDPATFDRDTEAYVHGVSLEPLRAAVATGLAATGRNGLRAAAAALLPDAPATFAGAVDAPAAVHVLQNNWFRLLGSGGAFEFDPRGQADFGPGVLRLATGFVRTRLFGGRPDGNALRSDYVDLLAAGSRGEGGFGRTARIGGSPGADAAPPAMLAFAQAPAWPGAVAFEWAAPVGCHELELLLRPVRGQGVLQVTLDGVLLAATPFAEGTRPEPVRVPVHVARGGQRLLGLSLVHGGSVALDRAALRRVGDVGVEAAVEVPAGNRAVLVESSQSSYHHETVRLTTLADFPGFLLAARCERAVRNLQVERSLVLPAYGELAAITAGDDRRALRQPFVLRATDAALPDLVVVPLQLLRHEAFTVKDGVVVWKGPAESGAQSRVGVLLCAHGQGQRWLADAATVFEAVGLPQPIDLGSGGEAKLRSDVDQAWTRVVQVGGDLRTPFLVCEQGEWFWRGSMPCPDGGRWLRVQQAPGDVVTIVGGPAVLARTRPGPGSLRSVTLRDPEPGRVTVRVLQRSPLGAPSVTMGRDFDEVKVDGESWAHFAGRTVFLPNRIGTFEVTTVEHAGSPGPHVVATRAPLDTCRWLANERLLVLGIPGEPGRPAELPWTAVLHGPVPTSIENGEIVDDTTLRLPDIAEVGAARQGGVLIRCRNGLVRIHYGD